MKTSFQVKQQIMWLKVKDITLCLIVILILTGCEKKWIKPTTVGIKFNFKQSSVSVQDTTGSVYWNSATFNIHNISFSGERKQSENVDFTVNSAITVDYSQGAASSQRVSFEAPQGTYTNIKLKLTSTGDTNKLNMLMEGTCTKLSQTGTKVRFELGLSQIFDLRAKENDGTFEVVLIAGNSRDLLLIFDWNYWFSAVTPTMWEKAQTAEIAGVRTILISEKFNGDIYSSIINRITSGAEAKFL